MIEPIVSLDRIVFTCYSTHTDSGRANLLGWLHDPKKGFKTKFSAFPTKWAELAFSFPEDGLHVQVFPKFCCAPYIAYCNLNTVNPEILREMALRCDYPNVTLIEVAIDYPNEKTTDWVPVVTGYPSPSYAYQEEGLPVHSSAYGKGRSKRKSKAYDKKHCEKDKGRSGYTIRDSMGLIHELADFQEYMRLEVTMRGREKILFPKAFSGINMVRHDTDICHAGNATTKARLRSIINDPNYLRTLSSSQRSRYRRLLSDPNVVTNMQPTPQETYLEHLPMLREKLLRHMEPFGGYVNPHWLPLDERRAS